MTTTRRVYGPGSRYVWILDAGHGVDTPGKRSPVWDDGSQLMEWASNRAIVNRIHSGLASMGIESIVLVPGDDDVPLPVRCAAANRVHADYHRRAILLSIHSNAADSPQATGWEAWTSPGETASDDVARVLYDCAREDLPEFKLRADHSDGDPDKEARFSILTGTHCPAVLTENLFMTNAQDCAFLMSDEGKRRIATMHVRAILEIEANGL